MTFGRMPRALDDQPLTKIKTVTITATDADGGVTTAELSGDSINLELQPGGDGGSGWVGARQSGKKAMVMSYGAISGQFVARGVEVAEVEYTAPPRPEAFLKIGDLIRLTPSLLPPNTPFCKRGRILRVKFVRWLEYSNCYEYDLHDRGREDDVVLTITESDQFRRLVKKVDRWPLRRGDFVKVHEKHFMGDDVYKLTRRVAPSDGVHYKETEGQAWWLESEAGPTNTWLRDEDAVLVDDVKVTKTVKWERG